MTNKIIITSSVEISSEHKSILEEKLKVKIGDYPFEYQIDSSLIAGFTVNFGDTQYNYDLHSEIKNVENQLI
jgi:F0F1-type ATP synthase delta subunit